MGGDDRLQTYLGKRDFRQTPEPRGRVKKREGHLFVVQKHAARRLHYDFRLELDGVLVSWAVTKGPSLNPSDKRLAVRTEDHPVEYGSFEGVIPAGYGAGTVLLWDRGEWRAREDPRRGLEEGVLKFVLDGERLRGGFALVRMKAKPGEKRENWLLIKERDDHAIEDFDPTEAWRDSVRTGRGLAEVAQDENAGRKRSRPEPEKGVARSVAVKPLPKKAGKGKPPAPGFVPPQLATLRKAPPSGEGWLHEVKYDGYRIQGLVEDGAARLITRNNKDWTDRYPTIAEALGKAIAGTAIVDGELVAVDARGIGSFGLLQRAHRNPGTGLRYYAFDLLYQDGEDLRPQPLLTRKRRLRSLLKGRDALIRYSDHVKEQGDRVFENACAMKMEGIVSKRADAPYRPGRNLDWIKSKCVGNDEFVVAGYRKSDKRGRPFASLLLGEYVGRELVYRGRVGTGFDDADFADLSSRLKALERKTSPFSRTPTEARAEAVWVSPRLVAQIAYTGLTGDGRLRHPSFLGLREDKSAGAVTEADGSNRTDTMDLRGVRLTHPGKVMFPRQGATKRAVAEYYADHAERMLPFIAGRPLSIVRCPSGRQDACFFQKHHKTSVPDHIGKIRVEEKSGKISDYLVIRSAEGLIALAQIAALELHIWGARADRIERPERLVFDLDPDEAVPFETVREAAGELREVLSAAGLHSFPLITGGKGIHVVVPLDRRREWPEVKVFARGLAKLLARAAPDRYVAEASKAKRTGRIFIDWLRNERGATAIAPYSLRAREGAPIATPVSWRELPRIDRAAKYSLDNIAARLSRLREDPWQGYHDVRQSITNAHLDHVASTVD